MRALLLTLVGVLVLATPVVHAQEPAGEQPVPTRPRIGLALSGGGARGAAHIGVLRVLEELHIPVDYVAGTSMGAIMGALYASGLSPEEMDAEISAIDWANLFHDAPPRRDQPFRRKQEDQLPLFDFELGVDRSGLKMPAGVIAGQKLQFLLRELTLHTTDITHFDELPIPYRAVAGDLLTGQLVVMDHGRLADAMRSSMAIPGAFTPVEWEGRLLVDGGIVQNLPVETVRAMGADLVIAVDIGTPLGELKNADPSFVGVTSRTMDVMSKANVRVSRAAVGPQDLLIVPDLHDVKTASFTKMAEAVEYGEAAARQHLEELRRYSIPADEYAVYQQRVRDWAATNIAQLRIDTIEINPTERVHPRVIERRLLTQPGELLDLDRLGKDLTSISQIGEFEMIDFSIERDDDERTLVIDAREKSWGPGYLRFGLGIDGTLEADADFRATVLYRRTFLNRYGAEWRALGEIGDVLGMRTDLYQPISYSGRYFVAPQFTARRERDEMSLVTGERVVGTTDFVAGQFDLGLQLAEAFELRGGVLVGAYHGRTDIGTEPLDADSDVGAWVASFNFDRIDNYSFPTSGTRARAKYTASREQLGADYEYDRFEASLARPFSFHGNNLIFISNVGMDFDTDLPWYDDMSLGGFFRLSGFERDSLRGNALVHGALAYFRQIGRLPDLLGKGMYLGAAAELGDVWDSTDAIDLDVNDMHPSGLAFLGVETILGPLYVGYGRSDEGQEATYLFLGPLFR